MSLPSKLGRKNFAFLIEGIENLNLEYLEENRTEKCMMDLTVGMGC